MFRNLSFAVPVASAIICCLTLNACGTDRQVYRGNSFVLKYEEFDAVPPPETSVDALLHQFCIKKVCLYVYEGNAPKQYNKDIKAVKAKFLGNVTQKYAGGDITEYYFATGKDWPRTVQIFYETEEEAFLLKHINALSVDIKKASE